MTISEAAEASGLTAHTLRYYERAGLLDPVGREAGGRRRYSDRDLSRIAFLTKLRATGMPIEQPAAPRRDQGKTHGSVVRLRLEMAAYFRRPAVEVPAAEPGA